MTPVVLVVLIVAAALAVVAALAAYDKGVHDGYRTAEAPDDPRWDAQRMILRRFGEKVRPTSEFVRGPGDEECRDYLPSKEPSLGAECQTDGHYLCANCKWNVHRTPEHECNTDACVHPELRREEP